MEITPHPDVLPPTPQEIDEQIAEYNAVKETYEAAKQAHDDAKECVVLMVENHGYPLASAPQSKSLQGLRNTATITQSSTITVHEGAVLTLQLAITKIPGLFKLLFSSATKHTLVKGAADALKALDLPERKLEKILSLFGQCFDVKTSSPSLKIAVIKPKKPAKKTRDGKAVA